MPRKTTNTGKRGATTRSTTSRSARTTTSRTATKRNTTSRSSSSTASKPKPVAKGPGRKKERDVTKHSTSPLTLRAPRKPSLASDAREYMAMTPAARRGANAAKPKKKSSGRTSVGKGPARTGVKEVRNARQTKPTMKEATKAAYREYSKSKATTEASSVSRTRKKRVAGK